MLVWSLVCLQIKLSTMALSLASSALAFAPMAPAAFAPRAMVRMEAVEAAPVEEAAAPPPLPKIKTMQVGDKTLAGDFGFDPLQISDTPDALAWNREAEVKHARLAMLAAFGWPISEVTNFGQLLTGDGRAPSLLNGGLGEVNGVYWAAVVALAVYWESKGLDKQFGKKDDYIPGMLNFDPLGADSPSMREAEIANGRVAMIAITIFALEEAITKAPIFPISLFH
jgi:hypothetical protein